MASNEIIRNVLVAVDVQDDFIDGNLPVPEGEMVVAPINETAVAVRESDGDVCFTRDLHPASTPHFDIWPEHCVAGTPGAEFHADLDVREQDVVISKGMGQTDGYSGWEGASEDGRTLETIITPRTAKEKVQVFLAGLATEYCVGSTGLSIAVHFEDDDRVKIFLIRDAIRAVNQQSDKEAAMLNAMNDAGILALTCEEAKRLIEGTRL